MLNKRNIFILIGLVIIGVISSYVWSFINKSYVVVNTSKEEISEAQDVRVNELPKNPVEQVELLVPPVKKILKNDYHIFQSFNNCGPASFSMALSYYGINVSQKTLGDELRPYQVAGGDNDDKSVTLEEIADKAKDYKLTAYHRPSGDIEKIKMFITYDMPILTRTWLKTNDDIGHYRVIKGYDDERKIIVQDDSLQGKNLEYTYDEFFEIWKKYNYEYVVLVPEDKVSKAEAILGVDLDEKAAWQKSIELSKAELKKNPNDIYAGFNLSVALYKTKDYKDSIEAFEKVEDKIASRTLWYQIEPILAYYQLGDYDRVFEISDQILNNHNRAYSELYILRGKIYEKQNKITQAKSEFDKARLYNKNIDIESPLILRQ
jgi:hypothetical protein